MARTYHYNDPERFVRLADTLPLSVIWRTALAQTWFRLMPGARRRKSTPPASLAWKRVGERGSDGEKLRP